MVRQFNNSTGFLYAVRDLRLDVYQAPFPALSDIDAMRMLMQISKYSTSVVFDFPGDFVLYCVGEFDYDTAAVRPYNPLEQVCDMSFILRQVEAEREVTCGSDSDTVSSGDVKGAEITDGAD